MKIHTDTIFQKNSEIISSKIDDEVVMMSVEEGKYFGLDPVGSIIWELLDAPSSINMILPQLLDQFETTKEQCEKDCLMFFKDMLKQKTLIIVP